MHLKELQKVEGLSKEEYNAKAEEMSRMAPNKDDDKLETQKMMYNPSRFEMQRMHMTKSVELLTDPKRLKEFALGACLKTIPCSYMSEKDKVWKKSTKVVGTTFKKLVLDCNRDALVLIYHPQKDKNRGLKQKLEAL